MTEGYCTPVFNALKADGKAAVPAVCYGYNGEMQACAAGGHECAVLTNTPAEVPLAMQIALKILNGGKPPAHGNTIIPYPMYLYVTAKPAVTLDTAGLPITAVETLKSGVNYFPNLAAGLSLVTRFRHTPAQSRRRRPPGRGSRTVSTTTAQPAGLRSPPKEARRRLSQHEGRRRRGRKRAGAPLGCASRCGGASMRPSSSTTPTMTPTRNETQPSQATMVVQGDAE